jgi:hypothetical protein
VGDRKSKPAHRVPDPLTTRRVRWRGELSDEAALHAYKFLQLLMDDDVAALVMEQLGETGAARTWRAVDLLRAANLPLLGRDDPHVTGELVRVAGGVKLSPVLVLRGRPPVIVEGYHRICAAYHCDPTADIHVRLS